MPELLRWLDAHINYERSGPRSDGSAEHDPAHRLELMRRALDLMDEPHRLYPVIQLTGTNGKTSTARMVTALLSASGLRVGTYTSPHLERVNERIAVDGQPVADEDLADALLALRLQEPLQGEELSYFELLTAAAFRTFADAPVHFGVMEVGVGGQWDATNVVDAEVAVITNVGLDHKDYLGPTRRHIATAKAGIIKPGATLVLGERDAELRDVFAARGAGKAVVLDEDFAVLGDRVAVGGRSVDVRTPGSSYDELYLPLHGRHQSTNAALAITAVELALGAPLADDVVRSALEQVTSPGRMEVIGRQPLCLLDGAHNPEGAQALVASLDEEFAAAEARTFVVGMLRPHAPAEMLRSLGLGADKARRLVACTAPSPRAVPAEEIAEAAEAIEGMVQVDVVPDVAEAVRHAIAGARPEDVVVVTGSLYVVGAARSAHATDG